MIVGVIAWLLIGAVLLNGFVCMLIGGIGLLVLRKKRRAGEAVEPGARLAFGFVLGGGSVAFLLPSLVIALLVIFHSTPPEGYVETDIVIEEQGYQSQRFTANGVVYETLDVCLRGFGMASDAVFTYKVDGFWNASEWGNYFTVENPHGFRLVCDEYGLLFAPQEELDRVKHVYSASAESVLSCRLESGATRPLSLDAQKRLLDFLRNDVDRAPVIELRIADPRYLEVLQISTDGLVLLETYQLVAYRDKVYLMQQLSEGDRYRLVELPLLVMAELSDLLE